MKYEYREIEVSDAYNGHLDQSEFNKLGEEGWHVVSVNYGSDNKIKHALLERQVTQIIPNGIEIADQSEMTKAKIEDFVKKADIKTAESDNKNVSIAGRLGGFPPVANAIREVNMDKTAGVSSAAEPAFESVCGLRLNKLSVDWVLPNSEECVQGYHVCVVKQSKEKVNGHPVRMLKSLVNGRYFYSWNGQCSEDRYLSEEFAEHNLWLKIDSELKQRMSFLGYSWEKSVLIEKAV